MGEKNYDFIVIGAGPCGYESALEAAKYGLKTALIESGELGGTCLNAGCIPTKIFLHASKICRESQNANIFGIDANLNIDVKKIYAYKNSVITKMRSGIDRLLKNAKIDLIKGHAQLISPKNLHVTNSSGEIFNLTAKNILIATGSKPNLPPIKGIDTLGVFTSDDLLSDSCLYKKLLIIGGGVIGVEFAFAFSSLGSEVTIVEATDRLLYGMDKEISQNLSMILKKRGLSIFLSAKVNLIEKNNEEFICYFSQNSQDKKVSADRILIATGRQPNTDGLFKNDFGLQMERGFIVVNKNGLTNIPGLYAAGDVTPGSQLAHYATAKGINAVLSIVNSTKNYRNTNVIPSCVYTDPEIAVVGFSLETAKEHGINARQKKYLMGANGKSILSNQERGFIKIIIDENNKIIGAQLMCARASDIIGELSLAITNGLTLDEMANVIRPHPTFEEGIGEAVRL